MSDPSRHEDRAGYVGVVARLDAMARAFPDQIAVAMPTRPAMIGPIGFRAESFADFRRDTRRVAQGLRQLGIPKGTRMALLVPQSIEFIGLVFAMLEAGIVIVLIDPGIGRGNMIRCLEEAKPEGFVAAPPAHAVRIALRNRFRSAKWNVTVGSRWFWGGVTLNQVKRLGDKRGLQDLPPNEPDDPAAVIFTTGSTGPSKGVLYLHRQFDRQTHEIQTRYGIQPGEIDLAGFPLFGLFNAAMGVTTVIPPMDPTRPAKANPTRIVQTIRQWKATQSFGSPALWNVIGRHCEKTGERMPTLKRVLSAGAPAPAHVLRRVKAAIATDGEVFTPYGATEALPISSISASEVLSETAAQTELGKGVCVGTRFPGIEWRIIAVTDDPIESWSDSLTLPSGVIGELCVRGDVVTREYVTRIEANAIHKIADASHAGAGFWRRMGDLGYLDENDRFWFCGRKSHRVVTETRTLFTICCEGIFNRHRDVFRSALVGIGENNRQRPIVILETWPERRPRSKPEEQRLIDEVRAIGSEFDVTRSIKDFLVIDSMPVDIRHNAKIFREKLSVWAAARLGLRS